MTQPPVRINRVHTVAVPVTDQERALEFYSGTLGFEVRRDATFGAGDRWLEVAPPGVETTIAIPPAHPGVKAGVDTGLRLAASDAGAVHAALRAAGADVDELLNFPGAPPMFFLRDPDGNTLVIVESP
ncbi:MAG TPA: VOC family protein [Acidimicrobiales bacterium]|nr:VOC family protein [Acidimicrobiales bacterium]